MKLSNQQALQLFGIARDGMSSGFMSAKNREATHELLQQIIEQQSAVLHDLSASSEDDTLIDDDELMNDQMDIFLGGFRKSNDK